MRRQGRPGRICRGLHEPAWRRSSRARGASLRLGTWVAALAERGTASGVDAPKEPS